MSGHVPTETPPLSVVLPTTQPWPELQPCLDAVYDEAVSLGAEVLAVVGTNEALPPDSAARYPAVTRVAEDGASVFRLRSLGLARARGDVVLITEDHCVPRPGWATGHLDAHARYPDADAIGGPVDNGSREHLADWALFLSNHASFVPPLPGGPRPTLDRSNMSYKRRVLPAEPSEEGSAEPFLDERLRGEGARFVLDPALVIEHAQSLGRVGSVAIAFHNARSVAGMRLREGLDGRGRAVKVARSLAKGPGFVVLTTSTMLRRRVYPPRAYASLAALVPIAFAISGGSLVGYLFGPGRSTQHIR